MKWHRKRGFQSHIGAIRIESELQKRYIAFRFQSHIGAIRIAMLLVVAFYFTFRFQSHIGAIRITKLKNLAMQLCYFNPTLVQLELLQEALAAKAERHFNPTLVQLEF